MLLPAGEPERMLPRTCIEPLPPDPCQAVAASHTEAAVVQKLISGAMAAADAAAAAAVAADSEAARRKERAEHKRKHKRQRKRHRDRGSHNKRTNKRKNLRRSEGRKARAQTRMQMAPVLSQLSQLGCSRQAVESRSSKQARSRIPPDADLHICATNELSPSLTRNAR